MSQVRYGTWNLVYSGHATLLPVRNVMTVFVHSCMQALQFEHRDLHRGNVLVRRTHQKYIYIRLDGVDYSIKSYGVMATIVDYTLSRVNQGNDY